MNEDNVLRSEYIKEQKHYTRKEIENIFSNKSTEELTKIIKLLRYHKILKIRKIDDTAANFNDMADEVVDVTDAIADVNGYQYVFNGVGLFIIGGFVLKCYPKYINDVIDGDLARKFKRVLKVLEKYNSNKQDVNMLTDTDGEKGFNLLEVMLYLMNDFYEYGLYHNHKNIIESNGTGSILWDRTVNQVQPLIVNNRPYYTELLTRKRVEEQENYFRRLHECILTKCSKTFAENNLFEFFDTLTPIELTDLKIEDFGDKDYILYRLERELSEQFNSRKQHLLKTMHTFISNNKGTYDNDCLMVYGTTSFHKVWEEVCANVMQNDLKNTLHNLSNGYLGALHESYLEHKDKVLLDIIDKPEWVSFSGIGSQNKPQEADTLIPDIISILKCYDDKCFGIFDAKYYSVQFTPKLVGQPGLGDITKQYLYNLAYKDFIEKHNFKRVWNCFLMPIDGVEFIKQGYANMKILQFFNFGAGDKSKHYKDEIDIILMPADTMYDWYLKNVKLDDEFLNFIDKGSYGEIYPKTEN